MALDTIDLVTFEDRHLDGALRLSREAGWPHRREDWAMSLELGEGFVALHGEEVVGTIVMTPLGEAIATISLVIVAEASRGRGLGRRLMNAALQAAGTRECRLTATADGLPLYEKLGFESTHGIRQHQGHVAAMPAADTAGVTLAEAEDFQAICLLDRLAHGIDRRALLRVAQRSGSLAVLHRDGRAVGYSAIRPFGRGEVIGPVVAQTDADARHLIAFFAAARPGAFLRIDTPVALGLSSWLAEQGLVEVGGGIAMRKGHTAPEPAGPAKVFGLFSQAIG